jgi:hypothetical protein
MQVVGADPDAGSHQVHLFEPALEGLHGLQEVSVGLDIERVREGLDSQQRHRGGLALDQLQHGLLIHAGKLSAGVTTIIVLVVS